MVKAELTRSYETAFAAALDAETVARAFSFRSPEAKEGVMAFRDGREPDFRQI